MKNVLCTITSIFSLIFLLTACSSSAPGGSTAAKTGTTTQSSTPDPLSGLRVHELSGSEGIKNKEGCLKANGEWKKVLFQSGPAVACVLKNKDAGKSCTDVSQCAGMCLAKEPVNSALIGKKAMGQCQTTNQLPSCFTTIKNCIQSPKICA